MTRQRWTANDIPDLTGRTAVVTGGNTGLGFEMARLLGSRGARVTIVARSAERARAAVTSLRQATGAHVDAVRMDQGSLESVREAATELTRLHGRIDLLLNNAGQLGPAERTVSPDGHELTFATNHLGVFALTGHLLPILLSTTSSRIVTMSSISNARSRLDLDDLMSDRSFRRAAVYSRSKLANLMFAHALARRLSNAHADTMSLAAHPGQSRTAFTRDLPAMWRFLYGPRAAWLTGLVMQDASVGVLGAMRAATDPVARQGAYFGPSGPAQLTGHPIAVSPPRQSLDIDAQDRLWEASERLTGVEYDLTTRR